MLFLLSALALADMKLHCAGPTGALIGLTSDQTYNVRLPLDAPANEEKWTQVAFNSPPAGTAPITGSFTGSYMQVLPDDRDSYHQLHGEGSFTMTGLEYVIDIATAGKHTLYLRWSAGDDRGAGDSLYVVMREYATDHIVPGPDTLKPSRVQIDAVPGQFAGCCWSNITHSCLCSATEDLACYEWYPTARAAHWAECSSGPGMMDAVSDPLWYLFAGQDDPAARQAEMGAKKLEDSTMDFSSEPWDATCEAAGTGSRDTCAASHSQVSPARVFPQTPHTAKFQPPKPQQTPNLSVSPTLEPPTKTFARGSGLDFAAWELAAARYRLVIYPREDGTAVDAFYLAGPGVSPPNTLRLAAG